MRTSGPIVSGWIVGDWDEKASKVGTPNHLETGDAAGSITEGCTTVLCSGSRERRTRQTAQRPGKATTTVKTKNCVHPTRVTTSADGRPAKTLPNASNEDSSAN